MAQIDRQVSMERSTSVEDVPPPGAIDLLDIIDAPPPAAVVARTPGHCYEVTTGPSGDRLTVRSRNGRVALQVLMTDRGPVLSFESAEIEVAASRRLDLSAGDIAIRAHGSMAVDVGGDCTQTIGGTRHTHAGKDRLEAGSIQVQANEGALELRSAGRIALDGEHIGLNDDPCPQPFEWSAVADGAREAQ